MEKTEKKLINVDALKREFGTIYELKIPKNDELTEFAIGYVRKPTRIELSPILSKMQNSPLVAMEIMLNTIWLDGDSEIKTDDELFFGAISVLESIIKFRVGELKKI